MTTRPVYASAEGPALRSVVITENTGKDISTDTVQIALVPFNRDPLDADAKVPTVTLKDPGILNVVTVSILIDNTITPGTYKTWARIVDAPESPWLEGGVVEVR